jgi:AbrB family looped-hinge helix DNA binding protein
MGEVGRTRITSQGQTSVPQEVRRQFGMGPGDEIIWSEEDGRLVVRVRGTHTLGDVRKALALPSTEGAIAVKAAIRDRIRRKFGHGGR